MPQTEFDQRDDLSTARGCLNGFKAGIVFWSLMILIYYSCSSCANVQPIITRDKGKVIQTSSNWIEVAYEVVNRPDNRRAANIYYKPCGHLYHIGDTYPDHKKELQCGR